MSKINVNTVEHLDGSSRVEFPNGASINGVSVATIDDVGGVSTNTANAAVKRDALGNFAAGTITAALLGNASTARTLQTARTINGTSFNGSANITTSSWGASRNISIGGTTKAVNGSGDVTWATSEMAAQTAETLATPRTINGVSFNGSANISINLNNALTAGAGLTSAGTFTGSTARTFALGTPGTISNSTTNSVSGTTHTHALSLPFMQEFVSAQQTISPGTNYVFSHGLGGKPKLISASIICVSAELGWSVGDEVDVTSGGAGSNSQGVAVASTESQIKAVTGANEVTIRILNYTTGAIGSIANENWRLIFRAYM